MSLSSSKDCDLFRSAVSHLSSGLDALWAIIRQVGTFPPSKTLANVLSLALQPANSLFPGGARLIDHAPNTTGISVMAYDYLPNLDRRTVSIEWEISGCGEHKLQTYQPQDVPAASTQCGPFNLAADVYINDVSNKVFSYDPNKLPVDPIQGPLLIQELVSFRTQHELNLSENSIDSYAFHVFAFVMDPSTNLPVDIAQFAIADSFDGLTISSHAVNITKNFTYNTGGGPIMVEVVARALEVEISRSKFMRGLTMSMFATNWALTIASAYIVFTAVTKGRVDFMVVILYGSMGMAILGIQKFYINPPPFGALLDTVGLFSQAIIVAVCFTMLLYTATKSYLSTKGPPQSRGKA